MMEFIVWCIVFVVFFPFGKTALFNLFLYWIYLILLCCILAIISVIIWAWPLILALFAWLCLNLYYANVLSNLPQWQATAATAIEYTAEARQASTATWLDTQRAIIDFSFFSPPGAPLPDAPTRLELRAQANARLVRAFGITNSLTTSSTHIHKRFQEKAARLINEANQDPGRWTKLYRLAEEVLEGDIVFNLITAEPLGLADCVRRMCLAVVLADNFGDEVIVHAEGGVLGRIAARVNKVWVRSKCDQEGEGGRDEVLEDMIVGLELRENRGQGEVLRVGEVLGIIMPQYETLWRVVLLTFVTAFHRQAREENVKRVEGVPGCLGKGDGEVLKLAQVIDATLSVEDVFGLTL